MTLTEQEKQAVTIHYRIDELIHEHHSRHNLSESKVKLVVKMCRKFLENIKGTKYETELDSYGDPVYKIIEINLKRKTEIFTKELECPSVYLTWVSFGFHHFIHNFCQEYDPREKGNDRKIKRFYKQTLESLTR